LTDTAVPPAPIGFDSVVGDGKSFLATTARLGGGPGVTGTAGGLFIFLPSPAIGFVGVTGTGYGVPVCLA